MYMAESLHIPLREEEMVEILQRGLRPRIRQQLLYVPINSVAQLRKLCLKGESLLNEVSKTSAPIQNYNRMDGSHRVVSELEEDLQFDSEFPAEVDELSKRSNDRLTCWNCRKDGHRYMDCMETRSTICYSCGAIDVYKPTCRNCNSGNLKKSEGVTPNLRKDPMSKDQ
ncbi:hypothetical protein CVS40_11831 [Lucilia cuprina]|nr:hypothetical protein CVS40_11831 [Lucilia cuprina]